MAQNDGNIGNKWFYRLYMVYGSLFLLLCAGILFSCMKGFHIRILVPAALLLMALLLFFFVLSIKKGILSVLEACVDLLDRAIEGESVCVENEETETAHLQSALRRFILIKEKESKEAKQQKRQIETLLSDISHQTKTPIANILLYSQLLEERSAENRELIRKLTDQSEKLKFLIQSLVELARLENGMIQCRAKVSDVKELLVDVAGDFYEKAQSKKIRVSLDCKPQITAAFDKSWMREAVGNVVDNGIKYTQVGGRLDIRVIPYQMFVCICISDSGIGISEEEIPKIFGRFYRGKEAAEEDGLGIGLYLARQMVTAQGGYIKVTSHEGEGTDFKIYIPAG